MKPFMNSVQRRNQIEPSKEIKDKCQGLILTNEHQREIMKRLNAEIDRGLSKNTHNDADIKCFITYVQDLPHGTELGKFLALDLGGTNFRVLMIHLKGNHEIEMKSKIYDISDHLKVGAGAKLFDHIAECLAHFMKELGISTENLSLGFTFSFPLRQIGLSKGLLVLWTKGFDCPDVVGNDVVQYLKDAIARRGDIRVRVYAILNDTTGTLMSCAWKDHDCKIGLIIGTGSNACYVEKIEKVENFVGDRDKSHMIINTEWGAFGNNGALDFVRTKYDEIIDKQSHDPGQQIQEKMISGYYMGELVRLILVDFTESGLMFNGRGSDLLSTHNQFHTKYVSSIESDEPYNFAHCQQVLNEMGLSHASEQDCANVRYICECISRRAAHLVSAGISTLINRIGDPHITVGVDGSLYRFHPHFHNLMNETIRNLVEPHLDFKIMLSEDGSGRGAALVAAVATREEEAKAK